MQVAPLEARLDIVFGNALLDQQLGFFRYGETFARVVGAKLRPDPGLPRRKSGTDLPAIAPGSAPADPRLLAPVDKRQILARMIANLRGIYVSAGAWPKTLRLLNLLLEANPGLAAEYRERALVHLQLNNANAARNDLERYLKMVPDAPDREQLQQQLAALRHYLARLN
jgi:tetratricopeptide (TPR) repeat protein